MEVCHTWGPFHRQTVVGALGVPLSRSRTHHHTEQKLAVFFFTLDETPLQCYVIPLSRLIETACPIPVVLNPHDPYISVSSGVSEPNRSDRPLFFGSEKQPDVDLKHLGVSWRQHCCSPGVRSLVKHRYIYTIDPVSRSLLFFASVVLGSDPVLHPGAAGSISQVCDVVLEATFAGLREAEPAHLRATSARGRGGTAAVKRDLHEPSQGWNWGGWAWRAAVCRALRMP